MKTPEGCGLPLHWCSKIEEYEETGCWLWVGSTDKNTRYGQIRHRGRSQTAHRVIYQAVKGPIPVGWVVDHLCRVQPCVNPDHLEPVTNRENTVRGDASGVSRERAAAVTHCPKGHEYSDENTYWNPGKRGPLRACRECRRRQWREWNKRKKEVSK